MEGSPPASSDLSTGELLLPPLLINHPEICKTYVISVLAAWNFSFHIHSLFLYKGVKLIFAVAPGEVFECKFEILQQVKNHCIETLLFLNLKKDKC